MSPREQFTRTVTDLLDAREDLALVYAEISGQFLEDAARRHPRRVVNVGIREQLLVGVGGGLALAGLRPVLHTFSPFLIERAFEQVKLDLAHQGVGAVLVGSGGSFDMSALGRTHQSPGDVALAATIPGMRVHAPATDAEVREVLREAIGGEGLEYVRLSELTDAAEVVPDGRLHALRRGGSDLVIVVLGALRGHALAAAEVLDATVLASTSAHPLDAESLRSGVGGADRVVVLEPWLEGTSVGAVASALGDRPRRYLGIGTSPQELRRYGSPLEHQRAQGLEAAEVRARIDAWG